MIFSSYINKLKTNSVILSFVLMIISSFQLSHANNLSLPDLGSPDLVEYDQSTEFKLGEVFKARLHQTYKVSSDLILNQYIRDLGHLLASYSGTNRNYEFYVIEKDTINAFAGPNGIIGIHTGLIKAAESEAELAAVIAHEISHVTQNHLSRRYEYASNFGNLNSIATLLAAILVGSLDPNAGMATLMGGMGLNMQQQLRNSRLHEKEADALGIQLLHDAGYDPYAMGDFFARLAKKEGNSKYQIPEILRTHPVSDSRLAEADNRAAQLKSTRRTKPNSNDFKLVKIKLGESTEQVFKTTDELYEQTRCIKHSFNKSKNNNSCLINFLNNKNTPALLISQFLNKYNQRSITISTTEAKELTHKIKAFIDLYPNNAALLINFANFIANKNQHLSAIKILEERLPFLEYKYQANKRLSELNAEQQNFGYAYFHLAQFYLETGNAERAKHYLEQAEIERNKNDEILKKKIENYQQANLKLLIIKDKQE